MNVPLFLSFFILEFLTSYSPSAAESDFMMAQQNETRCSEPIKITDEINYLTSSHFGEVCKLRPKTSRKGLVSRILNPSFSGNKHTKYGEDMKEFAKRDLQDYLGDEIKDCDFLIDLELPFLGASVNGLVGDDAIVKIACLSASRDFKPEVAITEGKVKCCTYKDEELHLKKNDDYYYQIQGQLKITGRKKCYFCLWTPHGLLWEEIMWDPDFWNEMKPKLTEFYMNHLKDA